MAIFDCCMAFNEVDMLELRFRTLYDVVDHFVVVESGMTHSGQPKPPTIGDALQTPRFAPFVDKIIYQYRAELPGAGAWERERNHRAMIGDVLRFFAKPEDWVIVGDADEIARPTAVETMREGAGWETFKAVKLELDFYYYDVHHRVQEGWAIGACRWGVEQDPNKIRTCQFGGVETVTFEHAGWHFSYFGDAETIMQKARAFMHHDWVDTYGLTADKVQQALNAGVDLWGRSMRISRETWNTHLPAPLLQHAAQYAALGWLERETEATWQS